MTHFPTSTPSKLTDETDFTRNFCIYYLAHATFAIDVFHTSSRLILDPYPDGVFDGALNTINLSEGLKKIDSGKFNQNQEELFHPTKTYITSSHPHLDHSGTDAVDGDVIQSGSYPPFEIERILAYHDEYRGKRRGGAVDILKIKIHAGRKSYTVIHLSDIGQTLPPSLIYKLKLPDPVDLLLCPIGGYYTIGFAQAYEIISQIQPKYCIPMHYLHPGGRLPLLTLQPFLNTSPWPITPLIPKLTFPVGTCVTQGSLVNILPIATYSPNANDSPPSQPL